MRGVVLRSAKRNFLVELIKEEKTVEAAALATLLKEDHIVVGDKVVLEMIGDGQFQIIHREERESEIYRLIPREQKKKVTAANCNLLVVVTSVSRPEYKRGLVDRYLLRAFQWKIPAILVFNKMDEFAHDLDLKFESERLKEIEVDCFEISAKDTNYKTKYLKEGIDGLKLLLKDKTAIMLGQSGVGKSALISALSNGMANLLSRDLGKVGKGAHTTTWSELVNCGDFYLVDSPGVRSMAIDDLLLESLENVFPDVANHATRCKFRNCLHGETDKGCFFNTLDENNFEHQMILSRLESYMKFKIELEEIPDWKKNKDSR